MAEEPGKGPGSEHAHDTESPGGEDLPLRQRRRYDALRRERDRLAREIEDQRGQSSP